MRLDPQHPILYAAERLEGHFGAARSGVDVLWALAASPHPVRVLTLTPGELPSHAASIPLNPVEWVSVKTPPPRSGPLSRIADFARRTFGKCSPQPPIPIINSLASHEFFQSHSAPRTYPRSVLIVRESPRHFAGPRSLRNEDWARAAMEQYTDFIFVSSRVRDEWLAKPWFGARRSFYIPNCCYEELAEPLAHEPRAAVRARLGLPEGRTIAICLASLQHRKGQDLLLDAWPEIVAQCPDLDLLFAGPVIEAGGGAELLARINALPSDGRVRHLGGVDNSLDYLRAADLLILPARAEAMPRVILEAMALKTPAIASDVDGIPELIEHDRSGLLFPIAEPSRLTELVVRAARDEALRGRLALAAYERYWSEFSRARQIERYGAMLKELAQTA